MISANYQVSYTKANGQQGQIIVKASTPEQAIKTAQNACFTGSNFNSPVLFEGQYIKPTKQGFAGSNRMA